MDDWKENFTNTCVLTDLELLCAILKNARNYEVFVGKVNFILKFVFSDKIEDGGGGVC